MVLAGIDLAGTPTMDDTTWNLQAMALKGSSSYTLGIAISPVTNAADFNTAVRQAIATALGVSVSEVLLTSGAM